MAAGKDMRRGDLIIPYQVPAVKESPSDFSGTLGSTLPMAAMFTRNKLIGWASVLFAIQNWLGESPETRKTSSQPAYFSVGMSHYEWITEATSVWAITGYTDRSVHGVEPLSRTHGI
ncbi:hypothetical protein ACHAPG_003271 [Botrytis cinerea]